MKKFLLVLLITSFSFVLFGCTYTDDRDNEPLEEVAEEEVTFGGIPYGDEHPHGDIDLEDEEVASVLSYENWAMPSNDEDGVYIMTESMRTDCVGVANGMTYGGDLLSSLIVDDLLRDALDLGVYTKTYIKNLEKKLATYTQSEHNSDFYAYSACNLSDEMDLVSGYIWPANTPANISSFDHKYAALLLANGDDVLEVDDSVRLLNQTATGAEVFPCEGSLKNGDISWTCFLGLAGDDIEGIMAGNMGEWTISSVDGRVVHYNEYTDSF